MHDAISLEKRGIPTAVLISDQFIPGVQAIAKTRGMDDYPFVVVKHPIGSLTDENLDGRAEDALPQVLEILLNGKK